MKKETIEREKHIHKFQFSHQQIEARGTPTGIYMMIYYVICPECGELREQTIIPKLEDYEIS